MANEEVLRRLLELSKFQRDYEQQQEQKSLVLQLASSLQINLDADTHSNGSHSSTNSHQSGNGREEKKEEEPKVAATREKFQQVQQQVKEVRRASPASSRASMAPGSSPPGGSGSPNSSECDLSDPAVVEAYGRVRDDGDDVNWMLLGYGTSRKVLQLYGSGTGGLEEFVSKLPSDEVVFGYIRMLYGDSGRAKFVFASYVPESLSGLAKAKANMHKPSVDKFLQYYHVHVNATTKADLNESAVMAKLTSAAGANYGTGGVAPAGSENFGNIKGNARSFFSETEKKGSVNISYNKDPLSRTTPVSLTGRAGITEGYITK